MQKIILVEVFVYVVFHLTRYIIVYPFSQTYIYIVGGVECTKGCITKYAKYVMNKVNFWFYKSELVLLILFLKNLRGFKGMEEEMQALCFCNQP